MSFGPDAPVEENAHGGKRSISPCALDVVPTALLRVGRVFHAGEAKYEAAPQLVGRENWRRIPARENVRHAVNHVFAWLAGDVSDEHLEHAACRLLMAIEREQETTACGDDLSTSGTGHDVAPRADDRARDVADGPAAVGTPGVSPLRYDGE